MTAVLFARKGDASASSFTQSPPAIAGPPTLAARPVVLCAALAASMIVAVAYQYGGRGDAAVYAPSKIAAASVSAAARAEPEPAATPQLTPNSISKPSVKPSAGAGNAYRVQLVSLGSAAAVRREWIRLKKAHRDVLHGLRLTMKTNRSGSLYRLQAGPLSNRRAATSLCATIKRRRLDCIVVKR